MLKVVVSRQPVYPVSRALKVRAAVTGKVTPCSSPGELPAVSSLVINTPRSRS